MPVVKTFEGELEGNVWLLGEPCLWPVGGSVALYLSSGPSFSSSFFGSLIGSCCIERKWCLSPVSFFSCVFNSILLCLQA